MILKSNPLRAEYEEFAHTLADIAAKQILPLFRHAKAENKAAQGGYDPVTVADKAAEMAMRDAIVSRFPEHGICGEEYKNYQPEADYQWILDPIDGTRGFVAGMPSWGVLIGLLHKKKPIFGLMSQPFVGERFFGNGKKAYWQWADDPAIEIVADKKCEDLEAALMGCTTPDMFSLIEKTRFDALHARVRDTRYGTDCYGYALLASGTLGLVCEADLKPFDILPMVPILKGAGAVVSTWDGKDVMEGGQIIAAATPRLHKQALEALKPAPQA